MQSLSFFTRVVMLLLTTGATSCLQAGTVWLSSLDISQVTAGWNVAKANRGITGTPLSLRGKSFEHGVGTHAASRMRIALEGAATRFHSWVGIDDSARGKGSVEFVVEGDGKELWKSGVLTGGKPAMLADVNVSKVQTLVLRVTDGGDGTSDDHADWADAQITTLQGAPSPRLLPPFETFALETAHFGLHFEVRDDGKLYQRPIGAEEKQKLERTDEAYPQAGDGYIWEPALQAVHTDGNTSTDLRVEGLVRTNEAPDRELIRIKLRDPVYPFQATVCFRLHPALDVMEQWVEIRHQESGPVRLERMASASLLFAPSNVQLTHFYGDWANEMNPVTEKLNPGLKVLDSKIGVRAHQFRNPSFLLSMGGPVSEDSGQVLLGSLAWSGSFQCAFDHTGQRIRALCGVNPFASTYFLKPKTTFTTPVMIWAWSDAGAGFGEPQASRVGA